MKSHILDIPNENILCIDIDDTLVMWDNPHQLDTGITIDCYGSKFTLIPNEENIASLKRHKLRKHFIIVWSQGGVEWAKDIVKLLQLEDFVDMVCTKPKWYIDDLPADSWMKRYYYDVKPKTTEKA